MTRPRQSILNLFDPLLSEAEPQYVSDIDSEEEFDPEKENRAPELNELSMTAFFSRTYKRDYAQPAALTKRLVDIGDVTVADIVEEEEEGEGDDENGENALFSLETPKQSNPVRHIPQSANRTPLAEITPESHSKQLSLPNSPTQPRSASKLTAVSSLTSLIESVNLAGKNFGHVERAAPVVAPPRITVEHPNAESSIMTMPAPFSLQASTSSKQNTLGKSSSSLLAPPFDPTPSTSKQSNRLSLDLHSSFNLQLQSETSFDLLNDRISFFDAQDKGMSSFLNALDEDSDAETSLDDTQVHATVNVQQESRDLSVSPTITQFRALSLSSENDSVESPSLVFGPLINQPNSMITPAVHRTAATTVPALRVVKRTKRFEDERATSSSATVPKRKPSPPLSGDSSEPYVPKPFPRTDGPGRALVVEQTSSTKARPPFPKIGVSAGLANGPRRILLPETGKSSKPPSADPMRPKVALPYLAPTKKGTPPVASGVPRPAGTSVIPSASKLPAPSGIARFGRKASAPAVPNVDSGSKMPTRVLPRRYATYGPQ